MIHITGISQRT